MEQLSAGGYDVVICDVLMGGMDGLTFTKKLRARADTRSLPVVLVSAHDTESDRQGGLAAGADAFLSKKECASGRLLAEGLGGHGTSARLTVLVLTDERARQLRQLVTVERLAHHSVGSKMFRNVDRLGRNNE